MKEQYKNINELEKLLKESKLKMEEEITNNKKCLYNNKKSPCVLTFKMEKEHIIFNQWFK